MSEQDILRTIITWLVGKGAHVTKYNATGYGKGGEPDLFVSLPTSPPTALYIEVKTPRGRLSLIQQIKITDMRNHNHWVCVATSVEDVNTFLIEKGVVL